MTTDNPSILSHISLGTNDMARALAFYDPVMETVGARRLEEIKADKDVVVAVAYGKQFPEFWIQVPENNTPAEVGNGVHVAFMVKDKDCVHRFHEVALTNGGRDNGAPGPRPHYGEPYYGCFVFDPDGNRIEANFWDTSLLQQ